MTRDGVRLEKRFTLLQCAPREIGVPAGQDLVSPPPGLPLLRNLLGVQHGLPVLALDGKWTEEEPVRDGPGFRKILFILFLLPCPGRGLGLVPSLRGAPGDRRFQ